MCKGGLFMATFIKKDYTVAVSLMPVIYARSLIHGHRVCATVLDCN